MRSSSRVHTQGPTKRSCTGVYSKPCVPCGPPAHCRYLDLLEARERGCVWHWPELDACAGAGAAGAGVGQHGLAPVFELALDWELQAAAGALKQLLARQHFDGTRANDGASHHHLRETCKSMCALAC